MALTEKSDGLAEANRFTADWVNDFFNLLTGIMQDQSVTLNHRPGAAENPTLTLKGDGTNPLLKGLDTDGVTVVGSFDHSGNLMALGVLTFGSVVSGGGQGTLQYSSAGSDVILATPQSGISNKGILFKTWNGTAAQSVLSLGGQFGSAVAYIDTGGNLTLTGGATSQGMKVARLKPWGTAAAGKTIWIMNEGDTDPTTTDGLVDGDIVLTVSTS